MNAPSPDQPHSDAGRAVPDPRIERHLVEAYARPLRAYYRTTPWYRAYGQDPNWQPEVVVRDFLRSLADTHRSGSNPDFVADRPLRPRLAADLRRALRDRRRAQRFGSPGG